MRKEKKGLTVPTFKQIPATTKRDNLTTNRTNHSNFLEVLKPGQNQLLLKQPPHSKPHRPLETGTNSTHPGQPSLPFHHPTTPAFLVFPPPYAIGQLLLRQQTLPSVRQLRLPTNGARETHAPMTPRTEGWPEPCHGLFTRWTRLGSAFGQPRTRSGP